MAKLHIVWDPNDKVQGFSPEMDKRLGIKTAVISTTDALGELDIRQTAIKLTELLLVQVKRGA